MHFILFDLDGTLTQTYYGDDNSYTLALSHQLPIQPDYHYWKDCPHLTDSAVLHHIYHQVIQRPPEVHEVESMRERFLGLLRNKFLIQPEFFQPVPGAVELITQLAAHDNVSVGVATGGWEAVARFKLETAGFPVERMAVIGSDEHHTKADFVSALIHRMRQSVEPYAIHYIGDSRYDMNTAAELNLNFVGIDHKQTGFLKAEGVQKVMTDYRQPELFLKYVGLT